VAIHEVAVIADLVERGTIVVACGGGGAPIYADQRLGWEGVNAVVDKDLAAAVLARDLRAELLIILTDVDAVYAGWGTPEQRALRQLGADEAERLDRAGAFGEGSMAPKVRAAVDFVRRTGGRAIITELSRGLEAVRGDAGTTITT
jgi:carbamate kinase